jgi:hypothetical protein
VSYAAFLKSAKLWIMQFLCKMDNKIAMENYFCFFAMENGFFFFPKHVIVWLWVTFCEFIIRNIVTAQSAA